MEVTDNRYKLRNGGLTYKLTYGMLVMENKYV